MSIRLPNLRRWLGPLGRYRPGFLRRDMALGFKSCDLFTLPRWARLPHVWSPEEKLLASLDLVGKVVYDVGAHTGNYSLFFSRQVGESGRVIAFEPCAGNIAKLERNLKLNQISNVRCVPVALGSAQEHRTIFALPGMSTTGSVSLDAHTPFRRRIGIAQVERLDYLMVSEALPPPDFIKIDVEGFEIETLRGALGTLAQYGPDLMIEIHGASHAHKAERVRAIARMVGPLGYGLTHAESGRALTLMELGTASGEVTPIATGHLFGRRVAATA